MIFCYNKVMKKLLILILLLLSGTAFAAQPLMLINPFRETILHFPSSYLTQEDLVVTVFLPESSVPLSGKYPVIYALDLGPEQADEVKKLQDFYEQKMLLVGISLGENKESSVEKISSFISRELVPYITANYLTKDAPEYRALALWGEKRVELAADLLRKKDLFGALTLADMGKKTISLAGATQNLRTLLLATRQEIIVWQETLEDMAYLYGADFVTTITEEISLEKWLNADYLFANEETVRVQKLTGAVSPAKLTLPEGKAYLALEAVLKNGAVFDYIPLSVRISPPYLHWNVSDATLDIISGAEAGKVKLSVFVDKVKFSTKIQLKK